MRYLYTVIFLLVITPVNFLFAIETQQGIVWKIEKNGLKPSYLMGTIHSDDSRVLQKQKQIMDLLSKTDSFTAEIKLEMAEIQQFSRLMFYSDGTELKSVIGENRYANVRQLMVRHGISEMALANMKPWAVAVSLSMPKPTGGTVLDIRLYQEASLLGKKLYGLETPQEQIGVFEAFSVRQQIVMLDDTIRHYHELPIILEEMMRYYLDGDLSGLERASEKYMFRGDRLLAQEFHKRVLLDRNYRMLRRMHPRLLEGNSFIAVGALHLPGEEGLIRLLEKRGYRLTPVY